MCAEWPSMLITLGWAGPSLVGPSGTSGCSYCRSKKALVRPAFVQPLVDCMSTRLRSDLSSWQWCGCGAAASPLPILIMAHNISSRPMKPHLRVKCGDCSYGTTTFEPKQSSTRKLPCWAKSHRSTCASSMLPTSVSVSLTLCSLWKASSAGEATCLQYLSSVSHELRRWRCRPSFRPALKRRGTPASLHRCKKPLSRTLISDV
mmetsp:Transcript_49136/g.118409  ORF Transcript_49136/g.118409 Transcript_49136/m.118409 type:complete len:204 (+) Transcript_49136:823-1434(+)